MKRLKLIMTITLAVTIVAVFVASWNLHSLYINEKESTMKTVRECAENAILLEMIQRMQPSEQAAESFIRLNSVVEMAQQKNGRIAHSDTLRTSLESLLRIGLEFMDGMDRSNENNLDSIFKAELNRHNLFPHFAKLVPFNTIMDISGSYWTADYRNSPSGPPSYEIYVSPMPGKILSGMWGIIIPFFMVIILFSFLTVYLSKTVSRMKTLEQMKDDFTHNMTHELKTPVAVAYSAADSMLRYYDQSDEARNKQFIKIIMQRLSFLSGMIENILSMSMERFKTIQLNMESLNLRTLVEDVAAMINLKAEKPINFIIDIPENLYVLADSLHLSNLLSNLLDNALKYSGEKVDVTIHANKDSITVEDNGIGIEKGNLAYIFDKFYRVASGDCYEVGGYGLGLFYVKQIVDLFGWEISVKSRKGEGSIFTIKFKGDEKRQDTLGGR